MREFICIVTEFKHLYNFINFIKPRTSFNVIKFISEFSEAFTASNSAYNCGCASNLKSTCFKTMDRTSIKLFGICTPLYNSKVISIITMMIGSMEDGESISSTCYTTLMPFFLCQNFAVHCHQLSCT